MPIALPCLCRVYPSLSLSLGQFKSTFILVIVYTEKHFIKKFMHLEKKKKKALKLQSIVFACDNIQPPTFGQYKGLCNGYPP